VSGPAVLLLHGQPGSGADWAGVERELSPRFRAIAPDRPGYGKSPLPPGGFDHNARAMVALLDELDVERAVVAGHSWGAGVALAMAEHHAERVSAVTLVCPVTPNERFGRVDRALADRRAGPLLARAGFLGAGVALARPRLRRRVEGFLPGTDPARWPELARDWRRGRSWRSFWVEQRALLDDLPALHAPTMPCTVVIGARDHVTSPEEARRFAADAGARLVEVPDGGHLLPMQRPQAVAAAIEAAATG
jgi:pimeloyl-ACP methyl ester carboxylesterase